MSVIFIKCKNISYFNDWCNDNNVSKNDRRFIYLHDKKQITGIINPVILRYGPQNFDGSQELELQISARTFNKGE